MRGRVEVRTLEDGCDCGWIWERVKVCVDG